MSLLFNGLTGGGGGGNYVDHGSGTSLDSLESLTLIWWDYPNTVAGGNGRIIVKLNPGTNGFQVWSANINAGSARLFHLRTGTDGDVRMNTNTRQASSWNFNAISEASGSGNAYWGSLTAAVTDVTASAAASTGTEEDHSAQSLAIGGEASQTSLDGRIAMLWLYNRVLTLAEIRMHQWMPTTILTGCVLKVNYFSTTTLQDLSGNGNNGTATNSPTGANHVPLGPAFGFDQQWFKVTAAAPGGSTYPGYYSAGGWF